MGLPSIRPMPGAVEPKRLSLMLNPALMVALSSNLMILSLPLTDNIYQTKVPKEAVSKGLKT